MDTLFLFWTSLHLLSGFVFSFGVLHRKMHGSLTRPLSYFVALLNTEIIRGKGINRILHGGKDGYYRCLISLPAEKLALLGDALHSADTENKWYLQQVVDHAGADQAEPNVEDVV